MPFRQHHYYMIHNELYQYTYNTHFRLVSSYFPAKITEEPNPHTTKVCQPKHVNMKIVLVRLE